MSLYLLAPLFSVLLLLVIRYRPREATLALVCSEETRVKELGLCEPKAIIIGSDGSLIESCSKCGVEWLWVLDKDSEPYLVYEAESEASQFKKVFEFSKETIDKGADTV